MKVSKTLKITIRATMEEGRDEKGRFTKGNLFSLGLQNNGRPPRFETPKEIAEKIAEYIEYADSMRGGVDTHGKGKGIYTIEGCALYLGFATVKSMYDYEQRDSDFLYVLSRYRLFLTEWNAQKLYWGGTFAGAMFWLKNWGGYKDESTQNQHQTVTKVEFVEKKRED